jgi:hypothetical protein
MLLRLDDLQDEVKAGFKALPCQQHLVRLDRVERSLAALAEVPGRKPPSTEVRPKTGGGHPSVTQADLDRTERLVIEKAERAAEETAEQTAQRILDRLAALEEGKAKALAETAAIQTKARDERRGTVKYALELAKLVIAGLFGAGIIGAVKCEVPRPGAQPTANAYQPRGVVTLDAAFTTSKVR